MVILIGGTTHVGKTSLAQKLLEKYKIPYLSIDHIKMGIYRGWPECGFTPESKDEIITKKIWSIIKGIIMTNIENNQNIIIEGVYLPYDMNEFEQKYYSKIIYCKIGFSEEYIEKYLQTKIIRNQNIIEYREEDCDIIMEQYVKENKLVKELCNKNGLKYFEINRNYGKEIKNIYKWIHAEYKKIK
ncbi:MAG: adenylate kinase [Treponema sp.]|jgi:putative acetyltransferase|nr:adenylate kinase [Treponema sp.]